MKITYIYHSCFLVELENCYLIFDYFKGDLPKLNNNKSIYVFASHSHYDHFSEGIFDLLSEYKNVKYILSDDITCQKDVLFVKSNNEYCVDNLQIKTLKSTDLGVAFIVKCGDTTLYHAGDLNDWVWQGESRKYNECMTENYHKEIAEITDNIDVAFLPLDTRQEQWYYLGMKYFIENINVKCVFPMHFWDDFKLVDDFISKYNNSTRIIRIEKYSQVWEV